MAPKPPKAKKPRIRSSAPRSKGRTTLCTPAVMDAIVAAYQAGKGRKAAATAAGVSPASLFEWLARGRAGEQPYVDLLTRIEGARTSVVEGLRGVVLDLAHSEDPHVAGTNARWLLERLSPEEYGRRSEVTGPKGGPVQIAATVAPAFSDTQLRELAATPGALEAAIRGFLTPG
jgi:hypothetical protein